MYYIYKIENQINHKKYIGLTNNIQRRRNRHFSDLKRNEHDNHFLQYEYNLYGKDNFTFSVVFEGDVSYQEIGEKEKEFIKLYDSYENGYNQNTGGNFGPTNGGSHLVKSDIFSILSALEFCSRPGQVLSDMFDVSRTTISRIKNGINHNQYKEEYDKMPIEKRKEIYDIFCESTNFYNTKINTTVLKSKRKLTKEQVFMILYNKENKIITEVELMKRLDIKSSNTFRTIYNKESYKDYSSEYDILSTETKNNIASLL